MAGGKGDHIFIIFEEYKHRKGQQNAKSLAFNGEPRESLNLTEICSFCLEKVAGECQTGLYPRLSCKAWFSLATQAQAQVLAQG